VRRDSLSQEGSVAGMNRASLNSKTYGLKIKSKHFLIIFEEFDLARYMHFREPGVPPISPAVQSTCRSLTYLPGFSFNPKSSTLKGD